MPEEKGRFIYFKRFTFFALNLTSVVLCALYAHIALGHHEVLHSHPDQLKLPFEDLGIKYLKTSMGAAIARASFGGLLILLIPFASGRLLFLYGMCNLIMEIPITQAGTGGFDPALSWSLNPSCINPSEALYGRVYDFFVAYAGIVDQSVEVVCRGFAKQGFVIWDIIGLAFANIAVVIGFLAYAVFTEGPKAAATDFIEYFASFVG